MRQHAYHRWPWEVYAYDSVTSRDKSNLWLKAGILRFSSAVFSRDFKHLTIASLILLMASSTVSPSERHPGRSVHSATNRPSSSCSMVILNLIKSRH